MKSGLQKVHTAAREPVVGVEEGVVEEVEEVEEVGVEYNRVEDQQEHVEESQDQRQMSLSC